MQTSLKPGARIAWMLVASAALSSCDSNEYVPAADTNQVPPAMDVDVSASPNVPDSTTGVSTRVLRPTVSGDSAGRSDATASPTPILRDTGAPRVRRPR